MSIRRTLVAALPLLLAPAAHADIIELTLSGPISSSNNPNLPIGQTATFTLRYDSSYTPGLISNRQAFYADALTYLRISSGSYDSSFSGNFGQIDKYDNLSNFDGIQFSARSSSAAYQFLSASPAAFPTLGGQTLDWIYINLASNSSSLWSDYTLPTSYNFPAFDQTINMNIGLSGSSLSVGNTTLLSATNLSAVPEPASLTLLSLTTLPLLLRKRK
jgi:hypothetical protein